MHAKKKMMVPGSPYRSGLAHFNHLLYGGIGCHFKFGLGAVWLYDNPMAGCVSHCPQNGVVTVTLLLDSLVSNHFNVKSTV